MYWETGEIVALDSLLASFAAYLRRKRQVSEQQRQAYRNFVHFLKKSIALQPGNIIGKAKLRNEIKDCALLAEKEWLVRIHV
jgi:phage gp36-like protein